jgi:hypothetical protein
MITVDDSFNFQVIIDPNISSVVNKSICFETGVNKDQLGPGLYEHHGAEYTFRDIGALTRFYEDLILGFPLPLTFVTRGIYGPDAIVAMALFLYRDLAIIPATTGLVSGIDLVHRYGTTLLAHVDTSLSGFIKSFPKLFPDNISKREQGERISIGVQWIRDYLTDNNPPLLGGSLPDVRIVDIGSNSFVLAESDNSSVEAWEVLYRSGYLRGIIFNHKKDNSKSVLISRKCELVWPGMVNAIAFLNDLEKLSGGSEKWYSNGNYIYSPPNGSNILDCYIMDIVLRV